MTFYCNGCEADRDFDREYGILIITPKEGIRRFCRKCVRPTAHIPDVYWDGKPELGLADDPLTGKPRVFSSRSEKAAYLKERGLQEAGDRGALRSPAPMTAEQRKHEVKMALKRVREMGVDNRRQEYLRIVKESRRYA